MALALLPALSHAGNWDHNGAFSTETSVQVDQSRWMARLSDGVRLSALSLPGTHDSAAHNAGTYNGIPVARDIVRTQSLTIQRQLEAGIRVLDIRNRHVGNKFYLHHGPVFLHQTFDEVLQQVTRFLAANPSETVLMRVKQEETPNGLTRHFEATFEEYVNKFLPYLWQPTSQNPTLGETRGKIVILQNFPGDRLWGLNYYKFKIQDDFQLSSPWGLHGKWESVKNHLNSARASSGNEFFVNYLSAASGAQPFFVAGGRMWANTYAPHAPTGLTTPAFNGWYPDFPRDACFLWFCTIYFQGTNSLTSAYIQGQGYPFVGIVMADFPGSQLIENVIRANRQVQAPASHTDFTGEVVKAHGEGTTMTYFIR